MSLIPWRNKRSESEIVERAGGSSVQRLRSELDRVFDSFFREGWESFDRLLAPVGGWDPPINLAENDQEITVEAELPGVDPKEIDVQVRGNTLVLAGEKKEEREEKKRGYMHIESRFGSFQRSVLLPAEVDPNKIDASYQNGVLTIRLTKTQRSMAKRIPIRKGE